MVCPIEQAFLCRTLEAYRSSLALLKTFSNYTQLGITVIPRETDIKLSLGLAKPQTFPKFGNKKNFLKELDEKIKAQHSKFSKLDQPVLEEKLLETQSGGATQIYIYYAKTKSGPLKVYYNDDFSLNYFIEHGKKTKVHFISKSEFNEIKNLDPDEYQYLNQGSKGPYYINNSNKFDGKFDNILNKIYKIAQNPQDPNVIDDSFLEILDSRLKPTGKYIKFNMTNSGLGGNEEFWYSKQNNPRNHLIDDKYDELPIHIHKAMSGSNLINDQESAELEDVLSNYSP
jgi:hypothetical protein